MLLHLRLALLALALVVATTPRAAAEQDTWWISNILQPQSYPSYQSSPYQSYSAYQTVDCQVGPWGSFSTCFSVYSTKTRRRSVTVWPQNGGAACPSLEDTQACSPQDCQVGPWSAYSQCDPFCGKKKRTRDVILPSQDGGAACPVLTEFAPCDPINCVVSDWTPWSICLFGKKSHTRAVLTWPQYGGAACPPLIEVASCTPVDCAVSPWGPWKILGAKKSRVREITCQPDGGNPCPPLVEEAKCNPIDCVVSQWSWSGVCDPVSKLRKRTRTIVTSPQDGGAACPALQESVTCVDCAVSAFGSYSTCNPLTGTKTRSRTVVTAAQNGGADCPPLLETTPCDPVPCVVGNWTDWSSCDPKTLQRKRTRNVLTTPCYGGAACPPVVDTQSCTPQDCAVSDWSPFEYFVKATDGIRYKRRSRSVIRPCDGGAVCPPLQDEQVCQPVNCVVSKWAWDDNGAGACPPGGQRRRTRSVVTPAKDGGAECPPLQEFVACGDCQVSAWGPFGACDSATVTRKRTRSITQQPIGDGAACPVLEDVGPCEPVPCQVSDWSPWGSCSASGIRRRTRTVQTAAKYGGTECPPLTDQLNCNPTDCQVSPWGPYELRGDTKIRRRTVLCQPDGGKACPPLEETTTVKKVDCAVGAWGPYSACDPTTKQRSRSRIVVTNPQDGGAACPALTEAVACAPVSCQVTNWGTWSDCSQVTGKRTRRRTVTTPCAFGGTECPDLIQEEVCPSVDCKVGNWTSWSGCSPLTKTRSRRRSILVPASFGGAVCPNLEEVQVCQPTDCIVSSWSPFTSCGNGKERHFRTVIQKPDGGAACPPLMEERPAPKVDCVVSDWSDWGVCDSNLLVRVHNRSVITTAQNGGKCCPALQGSQACTPKRVDCAVGDWSDYSICDPASNTQRRTRNVTQAAGPGGKACPDLQQSRSCKPAIDCKVGDWGNWGSCSSSKFLRTRTRPIVTPQSGNGAKCPSLTETQSCTPVDCQMSDWSDWTACDPVALVKTRKRSILQDCDGGKKCPSLTESKACTINVDCQVSCWGDYGPCDEATWTRTRTRTIAVQPKGKGKACPALSATDACPKRDCKVSGWSLFGACDASGNRKRTRTVVTTARGGGKACPALEETKKCDAVNCGVTSWGPWGDCDPVTNVQTRSRTIRVQPTYGGTACPPLTQTRSCQKCLVSDWSDWSICTADTPTRSRTRDVTQQPPPPSTCGNPDDDSLAATLMCPVLKEEQPCEAINCTVSDWTDWSDCDPVTYVQTRNRTILQPPVRGGTECPSLNDTLICPAVDWVSCRFEQIRNGPGFGSGFELRLAVTVELDSSRKTMVVLSFQQAMDDAGAELPTSGGRLQARVQGSPGSGWQEQESERPKTRQERTTCIFKGYKYTRSWASLKKISYRCSSFRRTGCKGTLEFRISTMGYSCTRPHTCQDKLIASGLSDVNEDMKAMADSLAIGDVSRLAREIWHELRSIFYGNDNNNVMLGLSESQVVNRVYRARSLHFSGNVHGSVEIPPLSLALNEAVSFFQFHFVSANRLDVNSPTRLLGWTHPMLVNLLRYHNVSLFIDGTFRCVPRNFQQCVVFMVHDRASGLYIPVFYILSTSRSADAYWDMMHFVLQTTDQQLSPAEVVCDFEPALVQAVQTQFRDAIVLGCLFHMKQALRRAMKKYAIPDTECSIAMTKGVIDMLTVVNPDHVKSHGMAWVEMEMKQRCEKQGIAYSNSKWEEFWLYFERTWILGYSVELWNVYGLDNELVARTNNPLERFNRVLNSRFPTPHPSMATFVTVIKQLSAEYVQQLTDIPRNRRQRVTRETIELPVAIDLPKELGNATTL